MAPGEQRDHASTPLPRKLGVREGSRVHIVGAPAGFELMPLPAGAVLLHSARRPLDVAVLFTTHRTDLQRRFGRLAASLAPAGRLWVAWPKKAARVETDLTFTVVQAIGLEAGLVDNKSASIDEVFQGLQFVIRLKDRPRA